MEKKSKKKQDKKPMPTEEELLREIFKTEERKDCEGMKIYISLPISGYDIEERKERSIFIRSELLRIFPGCKVFNPLNLVAKLQVEGKPLQSWEWFMARDIRVLYQSTHIYFDEKWESSKGCLLEKAIVEERNGKIIELPIHL